MLHHSFSTVEMFKIGWIVCFALACVSARGQKRTDIPYKQFQEIYDRYPENDVRGLPFVQMHIGQAIKDSRPKQLLIAYENAVFFSTGRQDKLRYADSAVAVAHNLKDSSRISRAYLGKGIVYYFSFRRYKSALNEYLKAYDYSGSDRGSYLHHKIRYHLGEVKSYLGHCEEALEHFENCLPYFQKNIAAGNHPNEIYNSTRGYLNTLHQMIVCNQRLRLWARADSLTATAAAAVNRLHGFEQEKGYVYKCLGRSAFRKGNYRSAIALLRTSNRLLARADDFTWTALNDFYIGKSHLHMKQTAKAVACFQKVDSSFIKHRFLLPELRENYELLITHYRKAGRQDRELYYTQQLLKVDAFLAEDFDYVMTRMHKEYDTRTLRADKVRLEKASQTQSRMITLLAVTAALLLLFLVYRYHRARRVHHKYLQLLAKLEALQNKGGTPGTPAGTVGRKYEYRDEITQELLEKLRIFEEKKGFTAKGLTLRKLASKLDTNGTHLSYVINGYKGMNFNTYLKHLRINYITQLLYSDRKYLNYTMDGLAAECGIASRQNFSDHFYEINGLRPREFIEKYRKENRPGV
ncbi:MAG: helix-turn-helix domain-containing protein [Weeksellaceae bacterium]|nr:helix-turn-helix domain-containing protein [Weeksellaceae bacterium]